VEWGEDWVKGGCSAVDVAGWRSLGQVDGEWQ
jgi:hypothetical protein